MTNPGLPGPPGPAGSCGGGGPVGPPGVPEDEQGPWWYYYDVPWGWMIISRISTEPYVLIRDGWWVV